ncbi:hypothetical protein BC831DRAFT_477272 [Entophlyctis helioformis]|nr:hypothetical protein BC831DRAFT_477272 [Entophlyctis helioformis]
MRLLGLCLSVLALPLAVHAQYDAATIAQWTAPADRSDCTAMAARIANDSANMFTLDTTDCSTLTCSLPAQSVTAPSAPALTFTTKYTACSSTLTFSSSGSTARMFLPSGADALVVGTATRPLGSMLPNGIGILVRYNKATVGTTTTIVTFAMDVVRRPINGSTPVAANTLEYGPFNLAAVSLNDSCPAAAAWTLLVIVIVLPILAVCCICGLLWAICCCGLCRNTRQTGVTPLDPSAAAVGAGGHITIVQAGGGGAGGYKPSTPVPPYPAPVAAFGQQQPPPPSSAYYGQPQQQPYAPPGQPVYSQPMYGQSQSPQPPPQQMQPQQMQPVYGQQPMYLQPPGYAQPGYGPPG